jgi:hypothetical protein
MSFPNNIFYDNLELNQTSIETMSGIYDSLERK